MTAMLALANHNSAGFSGIETTARSYEIVHATIGRVRIRVSGLASDLEMARKIHRALSSIDAVTEVRINPRAESVIVHYNTLSFSIFLWRRSTAPVR
jgi:hypothetical protein